jgi:hypothetical protein
MPRPDRLTPKKDPVPTVQEAGWALGPVWTGVENLAPQGLDLWTVQPIASHYTDCTIPAPIFWSILNGSENKFVHMQSDIKWYYACTLHTTHNQWHVVCGQFTKFSVYHHLHATIPHHCQPYQANASLTSTNAHKNIKITNNRLANHQCRMQENCITEVMWKRQLPDQKVGHLGIPKKFLLTSGHLF